MTSAHYGEKKLIIIKDIESVVGNEKCRIYWNYSFPTFRLIQANKPDVVLLDHQSKTIFVVEFSAPGEMNIVREEEEKRIKYRDFLFELRRLYPSDYWSPWWNDVLSTLES